MDSSSKKNTNNLRFLMLKEILVKYSDDDHPINASKIVDILKEKYGMKCDRKTIYRDIKTLVHFGFDVNKYRDERKGVYLGEREYELVEIRMLIDAILTAKFITPKKTQKLIRKLYNELSIYQIDSFNNQVYIDNATKFDNEEIYYSVDKINEAILKNNKIQFVYRHKILRNNRIVINKGKKFKVSPYALIWSDDRYYMVANNDKYDNLSNYRLDRMSKVEICYETARTFKEVSDYKHEFDVSDYVKKNINMFPGEKEHIQLVCCNDFLEILYDKFGKDIICKKSDETEITVDLDVYISEALIDWLVSNACAVKVKSPNYLIERIKQKISQINSIYGASHEK